jgi:VanZ family protein
MWDVALLGVATAVVVAGCLVPNRWLPPLPNDKLLHFASFAVLGLLALRIAQGQLQAALCLIGLLFIGWLIECLQILVPDRNFCWRDMGANAAGIAFAAVCSQLFAMYA